MKRRRRKQPTWLDSLPCDEWIHEPKVQLYRLEYPGKWLYLGTYLAYLLDQSFVATTYGGGEYLFVVVYRGRIVRKGIWAIEGDPIQPPWLTA